MGEVYRAHDTRLQRDVAIKVLPDDFALDATRVARFEREARTLAALNHPNIAQIFGLEEANGVKALVMELIEGPTLADLVARGPSPLHEAVPIAKQIAEALEGAHEQGIIHRDLKPANVKVRADGTVKVLDFGLAKVSEPAGLSQSVSQSPTFTMPMTQVGVILGTAAYMSPEQAKGKHVEKRADIWAFGCVLFEMLTGRRAFGGESVTETLANIVRDEPDWTLLPADTPQTLRELLRRLLQKDPARRLRDIGDAKLELDDALEARGTSPTSHRAGHARSWMFVSGALAAALLVMTVIVLWPIRAAAPDVVRFAFEPPGAGSYFNLSVAPDGEKIAAVSLTPRNSTQISVRHLRDTSITFVPGTENASFPFWSPDSRFLGFFAEGQLKKIDLAGGRAETLASADFPLGGTWNSDGIIVYATNTGLYRTSSNGGTPEKIATEDRTTARTVRAFPQFLPDNQHFLYVTVEPSEQTVVWVGSLTSPRSKQIVNADSAAQYVQPGVLLFSRGNTLMSQSFSAADLSLSGDATPIAQILTSWSSAEMTRGEAAFSAGNNVLTFVPLTADASEHAWWERDGKELAVIPNPQSGAYQNPSLSPDGRLVAFQRIDPQSGNWDIWLFDTLRSAVTRFTSDPAQDSDPVWSPDGRTIVFASTRNKVFGLYQRRSDSSSGEELLKEFDVPVQPTSWSADGRFIVYSPGDASQLSEIWALPVFGDRQPFRIAYNPAFSLYGAQVSPDSKWLAYASNETGGSEIYVQAFPAGGQRFQLTNGSGIHPRWRRDGKELFYWSLSLDRIMASEITSDGRTISAGRPRPAVDVPIDGLTDNRNHYAVSGDGRKILLRRHSSANPDPSIQVLVNWSDLRAPLDRTR
jgi:serine/threonine protein kinase